MGYIVQLRVTSEDNDKQNKKWTWAGFHNWINSICLLNHLSRPAAYGGKPFTYLISCESENPIQVLHQLFESGSVRRHSMPAISHHHIAVRNTHLLGLIKITRPPHKPFHAQSVLPFTRKAVSTHSSAHEPLNPQTWAALPALRGAFWSCLSLAQCLNYLFVGPILWPSNFKGVKLHMLSVFFACQGLQSWWRN